MCSNITSPYIGTTGSLNRDADLYTTTYECLEDMTPLIISGTELRIGEEEYYVNGTVFMIPYYNSIYNVYTLDGNLSSQFDVMWATKEYLIAKLCMNTTEHFFTYISQNVNNRTTVENLVENQILFLGLNQTFVKCFDDNSTTTEQLLPQYKFKK